MLVLSVVFAAAVGAQLLYLMAILIALGKEKSAAAAPAAVPVSVVICAHDEAENLRALLPLILSQSHPNFEVIVVNDRSNDGTYDFLLEQTSAQPRLRMVNVDRVPPHVNGKKYGITLGIRAASHDWILLTDADCRPATPDWISVMSKNFQPSAKIVIGVSPYMRQAGLLNLFIRFDNWLTSLQYLAFALLGNPYMGVGRNLAYRKSLFLDKKGFNQFLGVTGGDDDLFVNQHATGDTTEVEYSRESHVMSVPKSTWPSFFHQKVRHLSVGKRYRAGHRILLGLFMVSWVVSWFTAIPLLVLDITQWWVTGLLLLRMLLLMIALHTLLKQAQARFELWAVPFLDFLYSIYYISTGLVALFTKRVRWRK